MTQPLFHPRLWRRARRILCDRSRRLLVVLDLDGTIAPIAPRPSLARVPQRMLRSIQRAARTRGVRIAVLSARARPEMRRLVPVRSVLLLGQYGLEGALAPAPSVVARYRRGCSRVARALRPLARSIRGAFLEPKGLTVAVHDRNVRSPRARLLLEQGLRAVAPNEALREGFVPIRGRRVVDFVPRHRDKGRALRALRSRLGSRTVFYFGDSDADEPAFLALGREDFPVRVGNGDTRARYRVASPAGVTRFLTAVAAQRAGPA